MEHRMTVKDEDKPPSIGTRKHILSIDTDIQDQRWNEFSGDLIPVFEKLADITVKHIVKKPSDMAVSLVLSNDTFIQSLNRKYRNKDKPTNVLSFPQIEDFSVAYLMPTPIEIGDIVISLDTIANEAQQQGKPVVNHAAHMLVHGLLHLLGFDHICEAEATEMERIERDILAKLEIPDPYST